MASSSHPGDGQHVDGARALLADPPPEEYHRGQVILRPSGRPQLLSPARRTMLKAAGLKTYLSLGVVVEK